jgi:hypothetical protein
MTFSYILYLVFQIWLWLIYSDVFYIWIIKNIYTLFFFYYPHPFPFEQLV